MRRRIFCFSRVASFAKATAAEEHVERVEGFDRIDKIDRIEKWYGGRTHMGATLKRKRTKRINAVIVRKTESRIKTTVAIYCGNHV